ncbi:MAG TPA: hypothetical protein VM120_29090, partial [Bryobacteraceae bacterium]|nr:hypothetical protein [Bryobacteraceae bacterium]
WLGLLRDVREGGSMWSALFRPSQHGTWRPLGERAYFLFFPWVFGYEALPMRLLAFATQIASLVLLQAVTLRITGSRVAAFLAPVLWIANSKMVVAMISNGAYVHVLSGFFLLLALYLLVRGNWPGMWVVFLLGFGAMEMNVVFPALAATYCWVFARERVQRVLWLWPVSIAYYVLHMAFAKKIAAGSYAMHFDASMLRTLGEYWMWIWAPQNLTAFTGLPAWVSWVSGVVFSAALLGFVAVQASKKQFMPVLFLIWFVILLAPVLPLRGHVTDYYLTVPLAAVAMLGALACSHARWWAVPFVLFYLATQTPSAYKATRWWRDRSLVAQSLVRRVWAAHAANPGKQILLENVSDEQFWAAVAHYPFVERGETYVYLAPGTEARIVAHPESGVNIHEFFLPAVEQERLRAQDKLLILPVP